MARYHYITKEQQEIARKAVKIHYEHGIEYKDIAVWYNIKYTTLLSRVSKYAQAEKNYYRNQKHRQDAQKEKQTEEEGGNHPY